MEHAIKYFSFWDVPRTFAFEHGDNVYLLTSEFNDNLDDYPNDCEVFVVSGIGNLSEVSEWTSIEPLPKIFVERVPVASVRFDESLRKYVDSAFMDSMRKPETKQLIRNRDYTHWLHECEGKARACGVA